MTNEELRRYMTENPDFAEYVERFCAAKDIPVDRVLEMKVVENVALSYQGELRGWTE